MTNTQDAISAFLAKGGKVSKVAQGATCGMTARDFHKAARDPKPVEVVQETVYIPEQGMAAALANFLDLKGMFRIGRLLARDFGKVDAEFRADNEPDMTAYSVKARKVIRDVLLAIVDGFVMNDLYLIDVKDTEYHELNRLYRSVGGKINLI